MLDWFHTYTKEKWEWDKIEIYASTIKKLERDLGIEITDFSNGLSTNSINLCF